MKTITIRFYRKDIETEGTTSSTYNNLGNADYDLQKYKEAFSCYYHAGWLHYGSDDTICFNSGRACLMLMDYQGAINHFTWANESNPTNARVYNYRGFAKIKMPKQDPEGAIVDCSKAIELDPKYVSAYDNRGLAKDQLKDYQGAITDYSKTYLQEATRIKPCLSKGLEGIAEMEQEGFLFSDKKKEALKRMFEEFK